MAQGKQRSNGATLTKNGKEKKRRYVQNWQPGDELIERVVANVEADAFKSWEWNKARISFAKSSKEGVPADASGIRKAFMRACEALDLPWNILALARQIRRK